LNILLVGAGAREHAIAKALLRSEDDINLFTFGPGINPGLAEVSTVYTSGNVTDIPAILAFAIEESINLAIIGPEAPLSAGLANSFWDANIPCVGPTTDLARIETSKRFTRDLLMRYEIPGGPRYKYFNSMSGVEDFLSFLGDSYVVKYDGLMGGKGVKVAGDHLHSHKEAMLYCEKLISTGGSFLIEEKFEGEEFSLMSFCDGKNIKHMIPVQDHKRAYENDTGPNTGGMGSFTGPGNKLPFVSSEDFNAACAINKATFSALNNEHGEGYKGILYGGFMVTRNGVKLIEYNARFGDPEAMNLLSLLETDFLSICLGMVNGTLDKINIVFNERASVCKYAVPDGYPDKPVKGKKIDVSRVKNKNNLFYASVDISGGSLVEAGSRAVAVVGLADTLEEAERIAEEEISAIKGPLFHRKDIGTAALLQKRIDHMKSLKTK